MNWFIKSLKQYTDFNSRARRKEYWMFILFANLIGAVLLLIEIMTGAFSYDVLMGPLSALFSLVIFVPYLAVTVRRLHDIGKSGWMMLIVLIPIVGAIWFFILTIRDSESGENKYGENPKNIPYFEKEESDLFYNVIMSFLTALFISFGIYAIVDITGIVSSLESAEQIKNILLLLSFIISFVFFLSTSNKENKNKEVKFDLYYTNGNLKVSGLFINENRVGQWEFYYENGQLKESGELLNNKPIGKWNSYTKTGKIKQAYIPNENLYTQYKSEFIVGDILILKDIPELLRVVQRWDEILEASNEKPVPWCPTFDILIPLVYIPFTVVSMMYYHGGVPLYVIKFEWDGDVREFRLFEPLLEMLNFDEFPNLNSNEKKTK